MECPKNVSKELYDSKDNYPICKECPYVFSFGKCPYLKKPMDKSFDLMNDIYSKMSEEELREELKAIERELFI